MKIEKLKEIVKVLRKQSLTEERHFYSGHAFKNVLIHLERVEGIISEMEAQVDCCEGVDWETRDEWIKTLRGEE